METEGQVIRINQNTAVVRIKRKGACGDNCAHCSGCTADVMEIEADLNFSVSAGDWVMVSSNRSAVFLGLFLLFIMPLTLPLLGFFLTKGSGIEGYTAILGLLLSILMIWLLNKSDRFRQYARPQIIDLIKVERKNNE